MKAHPTDRSITLPWSWVVNVTFISLQLLLILPLTTPLCGGYCKGQDCDMYFNTRIGDECHKARDCCCGAPDAVNSTCYKAGYKPPTDPTSSTSTLTPTIKNTLPPSSGEDDDNDTNKTLKIIGYVVGGLLGLTILIAIIVFLWICCRARQRSRQRQRQFRDPGTDAGYEGNTQTYVIYSNAEPTGTYDSGHGYVQSQPPSSFQPSDHAVYYS